MLETLIRHCVLRRVAAIVITLGFGLWGIYAWQNTPIEAYPDVTNVQVNVIALYEGLAPEEIERQVTVPLERALNGTPGMTTIRSESLFGLALVWLVFDDHVDSFRARTLVNERLANAELPDEVQVELAPDYTPLGKVFYYNLVSDRHTLHELRAEQEWTVARVLQQVDGVAEVIVFGGFLKEFHVEVDPSRLMEYELSLHDVLEALEDSNLNVGGGFLRQGEQELVIRSLGYLETPQDIRDIVLESIGGAPVTVGDVARVVQSHTPRRGTIGVDDDDDVVQGIVLLRRGENPTRVLNEIRSKINDLNEWMLPDGMQAEVVYDRGELVGHTLRTVHGNLLFGAILIISVVWLFLRSLRGSLIVATVIPLSLMTAFTGLYLLGLPANLISMGAIDFGIIVDGAVVLVENVFHQMRKEKPKSRLESLKLIVKSAVDVARPTFYAMAIIIAALIPVFTLQGVEGRIFRPLALTYAFALGGALVFALTVVPALCAVLIHQKSIRAEDPKFVTFLRDRYRQSLTFCLRNRMVVVASAAILLAAGALVTKSLGTEFLPELDEGDIYIFVEMPPSISLENGQGILREVRLKLGDYPEVQTVISEQGRPEDGTDNEGINMAKVFVKLMPRDTWRDGWSKERLVDDMRDALHSIPGVTFSFSQPIRDSVEEAVAGVRGQVVLKAFGEDLEVMREKLLEAIDVLRPIEGIEDLDLYRDSIVPQLQIRLDRAALAREGISIRRAQEVIEMSLAGTVATEMWEGERPVPIRVKLPLSVRHDPAAIGDLTIINAAGASVPLNEIATLEVAMGRTFIPRENNIRYLAVGFNVEGRDMGSVISDAISAVEENVELPQNHYFEWGGEFENQQRAMARLSIIVPVSLLIVLLLLYGALGTARSSVVILSSVPFSVTGGAFALFVVGVDLSVSAAIGFIALLGQVSLLGLLVLSAVEDKRRQGLDKTQAIIDGATERFRAVLMAAILAAVGLLPMATSTGLGSETQRPFALVIVGGMVTTLLVAIYVLPVIYSWFGPRQMTAPEDLDFDAA